jgi:tripeptidyl-peptidase-1
VRKSYFYRRTTLKSSLGGLNNQTLAEAGMEANLDAQFAFGLSFPTPATAYSTAGRPPFKPDIQEPENLNGESLQFLFFGGQP